jgi:hypothetical protein
MELGWFTFWKVFLKTYLSFEAKGVRPCPGAGIKMREG